jgi:hypothetical protein
MSISAAVTGAPKHKSQIPESAGAARLTYINTGSARRHSIRAAQESDHENGTVIAENTG